MESKVLQRMSITAPGQGCEAASALALWQLGEQGGRLACSQDTSSLLGEWKVLEYQTPQSHRKHSCFISPDTRVRRHSTVEALKKLLLHFCFPFLTFYVPMYMVCVHVNVSVSDCMCVGPCVCKCMCRPTPLPYPLETGPPKSIKQTQLR